MGNRESKVYSSIFGIGFNYGLLLCEYGHGGKLGSLEGQFIQRIDYDVKRIIEIVFQWDRDITWKYKQMLTKMWDLYREGNFQELVNQVERIWMELERDLHETRIMHRMALI